MAVWHDCAVVHILCSVIGGVLLKLITQLFCKYRNQYFILAIFLQCGRICSVSQSLIRPELSELNDFLCKTHRNINLIEDNYTESDLSPRATIKLKLNAFLLIFRYPQAHSGRSYHISIIIHDLNRHVHISRI